MIDKSSIYTDHKKSGKSDTVTLTKLHAEYSKEYAKQNAKQKQIEFLKQLNNNREIFILNFGKKFRQSIYDKITEVSSKGKTSFTLKRNHILMVASYHFRIIHPDWISHVSLALISCAFGIGLFLLPFSPFALSFLSPNDYECQTHKDIEFAKRVLAIENEEVNSIKSDGYRINVMFEKYKIKW